MFGSLCATADRECPSGELKCDNTNICIYPEYLCDGYNHCGDNSDENPLFCGRQKNFCSCPISFPPICLCIYMLGNLCPTETRTCSSDEFRCDGGKCIPTNFVCDGFADCIDRTDEAPSCRELSALGLDSSFCLFFYE